MLCVNNHVCGSIHHVIIYNGYMCNMYVVACVICIALYVIIDNGYV